MEHKCSSNIKDQTFRRNEVNDRRRGEVLPRVCLAGPLVLRKVSVPPSPLPPPSRARLFAKICAAIQSWHVNIYIITSNRIFRKVISLARLILLTDAAVVNSIEEIICALFGHLVPGLHINFRIDPLMGWTH